MGGNISRSWFRSRRYNRRSFQGFDGREVSKSICTHERYFIPWYDLRKINIGNFKKYQAIPNLIWLSVIKNLLKQLEKNEDILMSYGFTNFAISGHTEGKQFSPWQLFDKSRYTLAKGRTK